MTFLKSREPCAGASPERDGAVSSEFEWKQSMGAPGPCVFGPGIRISIGCPQVRRAVSLLLTRVREGTAVRPCVPWPTKTLVALAAGSLLRGIPQFYSFTVANFFSATEGRKLLMRSQLVLDCRGFFGAFWRILVRMGAEFRCLGHVLAGKNTVARAYSGCVPLRWAFPRGGQTSVSSLQKNILGLQWVRENFCQRLEDRIQVARG